MTDFYVLYNVIYYMINKIYKTYAIVLKYSCKNYGVWNVAKIPGLGFQQPPYPMTSY